MKMSDWWDQNAKYVKAWGSYVLILWACQTVTVLLQLRRLLAWPLTSVGVSESHALWISAIAFWALFLAVGFLIFKASVRKFVQHGQE